MLNEDQLALKQIQRRMTSLRSSVETLQNSLVNLSQTSELSSALQSVVAVTSEYLSLMMAGLVVWQSETDLLYWTNVSAQLESLRAHWHIALGNLSNWAELQRPYDEDCDCQNE